MKQQKTQVTQTSSRSTPLAHVEQRGSAFVEAGFVNSAQVGTDRGADRIPDFAGAFNDAISTAGTLKKIYEKGKENEANSPEGQAETSQAQAQAGMDATTDQIDIVDLETKPEDVFSSRTRQTQLRRDELPEVWSDKSKEAYMSHYNKKTMGYQHVDDGISVQNSIEDKAAQLGAGMSAMETTDGTPDLGAMSKAIHAISGVGSALAGELVGQNVTNSITNQATNYAQNAATYSLAHNNLAKIVTAKTEGVGRVALKMTGLSQKEFMKLDRFTQQQHEKKAIGQYIDERLTQSNVHHPAKVWGNTLANVKALKAKNGASFLSTTEGKTVLAMIEAESHSIQARRHIESGQGNSGVFWNASTTNQHKNIVDGQSIKVIDNLKRGVPNALAVLATMTPSHQEQAGRIIKGSLNASLESVLLTGDPSKLDQALAGLEPIMQELNKNALLQKEMQGTKLATMHMLYKGGLRGGGVVAAYQSLSNIDLSVHKAGAKPGVYNSDRLQKMADLRKLGVVTSVEQMNAILDTVMKIDIHNKNSNGQPIDIDMDTIASSFTFNAAKSINGLKMSIPTGGVAGMMERTNAGSVGAAITNYLQNSTPLYNELVKRGYLEDGENVSDIGAKISLVEAGNGQYLLQLNSRSTFGNAVSDVFAIPQSTLKGSWSMLQNQMQANGTHLKLAVDPDDALKKMSNASFGAM